MTTWLWSTHGQVCPRGTRPPWVCSESCFSWSSNTTSLPNSCMSRGKHNVLADTLSRNLMTNSFCHATQANPPPPSGAFPFGQGIKAQLDSLINSTLATLHCCSISGGHSVYLSFCHKQQVCPVPASKHYIAVFTTNFWSTGTLLTICIYLAAVSFLYHASGVYRVQ